jgi:LCP family protein required for cell wall assembly
MPPPPEDLVEEGGAAAPIEDVVMAELAPEGTYRSFLLIGSDEAAGIADVILLTVLPTDGAEPFIVSLPRDLYVPNRCTNDYTRINATLHGCGDINGPTALSLAVEDFTGITVDHFALFDFNGFADIVDGVGGVEICVENDRRDWRAKLDIPAGCSMADGATTLAWVRSRHPLEFVDGQWRTVSGASDLLRNQHQQEVVLQLFAKLKAFDSPSDLANKVEELTEAFTLDSGLGAGDAIALAWSLRALDIASINRLEVPVVYATTRQGQSVLRATMPFDEILAELYPNLLEAAADERGPDSG